MRRRAPCIASYVPMMGTVARGDTSTAAIGYGAAALQRGWVVSAEYRALIAALADLRQELGISQRELARRLDKPPSFVNKIELLERRLDILEFVAIAEAMGRPADTLLASLRSNLPEQLKL